MLRLKQSVFLRKLRASLFCLPLLSLFLLPQLFFGYLVPQKTSTEVIHGKSELHAVHPYL